MLNGIVLHMLPKHIALTVTIIDKNDKYSIQYKILKYNLKLDKITENMDNLKQKKNKKT